MFIILLFMAVFTPILYGGLRIAITGKTKSSCVLISIMIAINLFILFVTTIRVDKMPLERYERKGNDISIEYRLKGKLIKEKQFIENISTFTDKKNEIIIVRLLDFRKRTIIILTKDDIDKRLITKGGK